MAKAGAALRVTQRSIDSVKPYERNPRKIGEASIEAVARSIQEFGFRQPIVVDKAGVIIVGHTRYWAAKRLGLKKVPVSVAADLTAAQVKAYRIADNKTGELAKWDTELLPFEIGELHGLEFDLGTLGFGERELRKLVGDTFPAEDDDDCPPRPTRKVRTKLGDVWVLGDNRLVCGDARDETCWGKLRDQGLGAAACLHTDPPYGVDLGIASSRESAARRRRTDGKGVANDELIGDKLREFLKLSLGQALEHMKGGGVWYIWHADNNGLDFRQAVVDLGQQVRQCLIWAKDTMVIGRQDYQWQHEPCLYGWTEGSHSWYSDRTQTTVLHFDRPKRSQDHPTMKPVELCAYLLGNSTQAGDQVIEPFAGSGSTLIAAQRLGRPCFAIELDPAYCDVVVKRWEKYTGRKAKKA